MSDLAVRHHWQRTPELRPRTIRPGERAHMQVKRPPRLIFERLRVCPPGSDLDADGVCDVLDLSAAARGLLRSRDDAQLDTDRDGLPDAIDPDDDNDGRPDDLDPDPKAPPEMGTIIRLRGTRPGGCLEPQSRPRSPGASAAPVRTSGSSAGPYGLALFPDPSSSRSWWA